MNQFVNITTPHGITTRHGGVSEGPFATMNTGFYGQDDPIKVFENIKIALDAIHADAKIIIATKQVHSNTIRVIDSQTDFSEFESYDVSGSALEGYTLLASPTTDGLVSTRDDVVLMTFFADCVPLVFYDPIKGIVGSVHSGWKGTSNLMAHEAINTFVSLGSMPKDIVVGIGHCAGVCCYEVDEPVVEAFRHNFTNDEMKNFLIAKENGKYQMDLKMANVIALMRKGLALSQIEVNDACTICGVSDYHSHRRTGHPRGSMSAFIQLKGETSQNK